VSAKNDRVASFSASSAGCGSCKNPDLVAPGAHLQGLRVGNSWIDTNYPSARLGAEFFRGSGTSEASAIVSGAVALLLQKYPTMSPDLVKRFLKDNAAKLGGFDSQAQGAGQIRLAGMAGKTPQWSYTGQKFGQAAGTGSLERARGQDHVTRDGVVLNGEVDIFGHTVDTATLASTSASGSSWSGGTWNGSSWSGSSWSGSSWSGSSWSGSSWSGSSWSGSSWSGSSWSGSSWSGDAWTGNSWASAGWS
jgi:serine protease AprX